MANTNFIKDYKIRDRGKPSYTYIRAREGRTLKGVPPLKINTWAIGNRKEKFLNSLEVITKETTIVSENCLEACRVFFIKNLNSLTSNENYYLHIRPYCHHILRKHKKASGKNADRISMGMRLAFGRPFARVARIKAGQTIFRFEFRNIKLVLKFKTCLLKVGAITNFKVALK